MNASQWMVRAMAQLVCFPLDFEMQPMMHALFHQLPNHGAQLRLMIMVYTSVDRVNGVIVTVNVLVMMQDALF